MEVNVDQVKVMLDAGLKTISVKTESTVEKAKLLLKIESLKKKVKKAYTNLGQEYYQKVVDCDTDLSTLADNIIELKDLNAEIDSLNKEIIRVEEEEKQKITCIKEQAQCVDEDCECDCDDCECDCEECECDCEECESEE